MGPGITTHSRAQFVTRGLTLPAFLLVLMGLLAPASFASPADFSLVHEPWFEVRTSHFQLYSCGSPTSVYKLAGRLEQFCAAYAALAGGRAVASVPIVVLAFPDHEKLKPFLPLYQGQPRNISAFFQHGTDENLIVLSLPEGNSGGDDLSVIFHEYAHLLFRNNDHIWPLWLKEGMAEAYSTFQTSDQMVSIASPIQEHLDLLHATPLMPLTELFSVKHDSPQYNEQSRQGLFYAESWLLTQFLMAGDQPVLRARFGQVTTRLRAGEDVAGAITNALGISLAGLESELRRYLAAQHFEPIWFKAATDLASPVAMHARRLTPVEVYYRLGDELLRIDRADTAATFFDQAEQLAPASPLPYEGKGLLAAEAKHPAEALQYLAKALELHSSSFLVYFVHAQERYKLLEDASGRHAPIKNASAGELRAEMQKSLALMPSFAPAQELLGFFEMVQGDFPAAAEQHLLWAIQLEPANSSYLFTLAQYQYRNGQAAAARQTLEPLLKPNIDPDLRHEAEKLIQEEAK